MVVVTYRTSWDGVREVVVVYAALEGGGARRLQSISTSEGIL